MQTEDFEWDDAKAASNLKDHRVSFDTARRAFDDPYAFEALDDREAYGEDRYLLLGMVDGRLLHVAYTYRGERTRIITAYGATPFEHQIYHEFEDAIRAARAARTGDKDESEGPE
ncbi:MAG: BrnT family toxin [Legionella sp.]|nr:BrnT family toxin [Legionella sp.]